MASRKRRSSKGMLSTKLYRARGVRAYCPQARKQKLKFKDQLEAKLYRNHIRSLDIKDENSLRVYECKACHGYHLSSKPQLGPSDGEAPQD